MTNFTRESLLKRPFNDFRNYPYGFSRSGDFSIRESDALTQYGVLISALLSGEYAPQNQEDDALLASARGEQAPTTLVEKAWAKRADNKWEPDSLAQQLADQQNAKQTVAAKVRSSFARFLISHALHQCSAACWAWHWRPHQTPSRRLRWGWAAGWSSSSS